MKCKCIVCKTELDNLDDNGNQPSGGTEFTTHGHYGSSVTDFMDGTMLALNICDPCVVKARQEGIMLIVDPRKPAPKPDYRVWR